MVRPLIVPRYIESLIVSTFHKNTLENYTAESVELAKKVTCPIEILTLKEGVIPFLDLSQKASYSFIQINRLVGLTRRSNHHYIDLVRP
jgi:hypothetical protein